MYLNCHSYYSLRFGTFSEVDLLELARENHVTQLALTDINNTSACLNFIRKASTYNIKPIVGIDFRNGINQQFVGIAKNNEGFRQLNTWLSEHLHLERPIPQQAPDLPGTVFIYPFEKVLLHGMEAFKEHEYIGISVKDLRKLPFSKYIGYKDKLIVLQPVTFRSKRDYNAHRLLRAIGNNILLSKLSTEEVASEDEKMYPVENLYQAFREYPFILENTDRLFPQCSIDFDFTTGKQSQNQQTYTKSEQDDYRLLEKLCLEQISYRYPDGQQQALERMWKELELIKKMSFVSYFLINYDIVRYAKAQGYFHVGRGSGANSIVAYLLGITDVDPLELDLYFERFMNLFRSTPPDFDIDFSWRDREDMTRYIFERFPHVALMGTYVTFNYKGVVRELGKVFGLPKEDIDRLSERQFDHSELDEVSRLVLRYGSLITGMPNYISVHSSGIIISEKPLQYFTTTFLPPKGYPTVQFDMHIAEDVGLYKFDILGQRGLAKIKETLEIIRYNRPEVTGMDIHDVQRFKKDRKVNGMLKRAQCMGCFYVESPAMRMLLKKLEVDNYLGLVAASSIIRPGVAQSGMMREYILRHHDPKRMKQAHPVLLDIMPDTYGVMVYQEDVIKVAHHFAGLTLAEADVLRRGMSGKYRSRDEFKAVEEKFISNCRQKGYEDSVTLEVWKQIESFAGYAFAKGHSASYAVESYQSMFLRAYFPLEFMTAVLNNGGGFYRPEIYIHEARMLGATIHSPCINRSYMENRIRGKDIFLGFGYLKDLEDRAVQRILKERETNGIFTSLEDFIDRVHISIEQLSILIRMEAFGFTGIDKYELLWQAHFSLGHTRRFESQYQLFKVKQNSYEIPVLKTTHLEAAFDQLELLGFALCSPFDLLLEPPQSNRLTRDFNHCLNHCIDIYGYLVTTKRTSSRYGEEMFFATFLDQSGEVFDAVLFPPVAKQYRFRGKGIYRIYGKVVEEFGFLSLEVVKMRKESYVQDPRFSG
ncbi:DNA polymerase III subunit alpha [Sinomicrobium weinanense]|uniref:DNA-directed DNA polymerase n=1 Tax=Sinomicrobium weinanense TaxID=2842200 RepID=A0A926Q5W3_9FLAO|nr:DNA polymerase III subunit alpha [Sinomicrobium weinanense]MBC9798415.1 DNA polymerase III subunit alpha [Sinomicrobium weinanense]MBU3125995.1 DNA polymerase III subunit alpha [Sinomicrobium weinanense]